MSLDTQIITLIFSFLYGIIFELTLSIVEKIIHHKSKIISYTSTFLFVIIHVIIYFIILQKINYGVVHIYSLLSLVLGYMSSAFIRKYLYSRFTIFHKKWYNLLIR